MSVDALRSLPDQLLELSPELAQITSPDGTFIATNARWRHALGYTADDLARVTVFDLIADSHRESFRLITARMLQGDDTGIFELPFRARGGGEVLLEGQGLVHAGEDGRVSVFCTFREPAARRSGHEHLQVAVALGRAALAEVRDGVLAVDRFDCLTGLNPAAERIAALAARDGLGRPLGDVCRLADDLTGTAIGSLTAEAVRTGERQTPASEVVLVYPDGRTVSVDASALPLVGASGAVTGAVLVLRDLTEVREARRSFRDARAAGARRLDALRLLAGGIAHDLNNALAPIPLIVSSLQEECPERARELDVLAVSTDRAVSTIRQLLTFARGASAPSHAIDPRAVLLGAADVVRATFPEGIDVRTVVASDVEP
ncbi:MAG: PAS domain-containing protein, partial [Vicinamibacterales bacterium]